MGFKTSRIQWLSGLVCDNLYDCLTSDKEKKRKKSLTLAPLAFNTAAWRGPGRHGKWLVVRLKGKCKPTCGDLFPRVCRSYSNQQQSVFLSVVFTTPSPENSPGWATCSPPSAADLPNLCTQLPQADPTNTNTTTPTSLRWRNPISMVTHPPAPTKPSPRCVGGGISTPSAPPAVGGRRSYREATVSAPAARPSYPGGAAARSRRWSAELLSPPRWDNTPLWIPGSFCLRYTKINHTFFPFSLRLSLAPLVVRSLLHWFIQMSKRVSLGRKNQTKQKRSEACWKAETSSCRPAASGETARGRRCCGGSVRRTDCGCETEQNWIFEEIIAPPPPPPLRRLHAFQSLPGASKNNNKKK